MTVDVEDYFQVQAFADRIDPATWDRWPRRVEANTSAMLDMLAARGVKATFFTLGWVADRHRTLVRRIVDEGHELASHGYGHARVWELGPKRFRADAARAKAVLEDTAGVAVKGYRAPSFSFGPGTPWAYDILAETGHRYSSSLFPVAHDHYGVPDAPRGPHPMAGGAVLEIPPATCRALGRNLPCAGGGWFRLYPLGLSQRLFRRAADQLGHCVFYIHPWEIDPDQPRPRGLPLRSRFRHYVNLRATAMRLDHVLRSFRWDRMDRIFLALR